MSFVEMGKYLLSQGEDGQGQDRLFCSVRGSRKTHWRTISVSNELEVAEMIAPASSSVSIMQLLFGYRSH